MLINLISLKIIPFIFDSNFYDSPLNFDTKLFVSAQPYEEKLKTIFK